MRCPETKFGETENHVAKYFIITLPDAVGIGMGHNPIRLQLDSLLTNGCGP